MDYPFHNYVYRWVGRGVAQYRSPQSQDRTIWSLFFREYMALILMKSNNIKYVEFWRKLRIPPFTFKARSFF